jgi:outer membrane cobalamin receptor
MNRIVSQLTFLAVAACGAVHVLHSAGLPAAGLDEVVITASRANLIAEVESASQGIVLSGQLESRPALRPGELLEVVPGLVVTQHSGDGKANQYFCADSTWITALILRLAWMAFP